MSCDIRIGTSGYHYKHWVGTFYPPKTPASKMLDYYVHHFDTLELNNSFYRLPTIEAFESWRDATPKNFTFAVKASRFITHNKKLKDPENALDNILPRAEHLGKKLGPVLFQLPPKWKVNLERLEGLLKMLPREHRYAFEFRELSWMTPEVNRLLERLQRGFLHLRTCRLPLVRSISQPTSLMSVFTAPTRENTRAVTARRSCAHGRNASSSGRPG